MSEEKKQQCSQYHWVSQDEQEQCSAEAVGQVNGRWYCRSCIDNAQVTFDNWNEAEAQGVVINQYGEKLRPSSPLKQMDTPISSAVHMVCNGWTDMREVSETHSVITCRSCGLRVVIPTWQTNWAILKKASDAGQFRGDTT